MERLKAHRSIANDTINNHEIGEIKKLSEGVAKLWQVLYDKQRENVLQWPTALSKAFRDAVEKMQFDEDIPRDLRDNYQNYIELHFPELPKQISARPIEANEAGGPGGAISPRLHAGLARRRKRRPR